MFKKENQKDGLRGEWWKLPQPFKIIDQYKILKDLARTWQQIGPSVKKLPGGQFERRSQVAQGHERMSLNNIDLFEIKKPAKEAGFLLSRQVSNLNSSDPEEDENIIILT